MIINFLSKVEYLIFFPFNIVYQIAPRHSMVWQISNFLKIIYKVYIKNYQPSFFSKNKNLIMTYDCKVSPPTYGDFFRYLMIAKYYKIKKRNVIFIIIIGEYRGGWKRLKDKKGIMSHQKILIDIYKFVFGNTKNLKLLNWKEFDKYRKKNSFNILFKADTLMRKPTYFLSTFFLNKKIKKEKEEFINKFLFKKKKIINKKFKKDFKNSKFITFSVRFYPKPYSQIRNIDYENFLKSIKIIKKRFLNHKILIISDDNGCSLLKKFSKKKKLDLKFSKNYSNTYVDDGNLILNSNLNIQYTGGGISEFAIFSKVPYLHYTFFYDFAINFHPLNPKKYNWQSDDQYKYFSFSNKIYYNLLNRI